MLRSKFYQQLLILSGIVWVLLVGLANLSAFVEEYMPFYQVSTATLALICAILFEGGKRTSEHPNRQLFGQFFLLSIGIKMMLTLVVFMIYIRQYPPTTTLFVLPFFGLYALYTGFEVYFLTVLGKTNVDEDNETNESK